MRYSVLLPTRNGASLLEPCIRSVLRHDRDDFELVVSNNASEDGTREILASIDDERLVVVDLQEPVPVTDNWNVALAHSSGDRITLIGDDDQLLDGYFDRADALIERHDDPDVLLFSAYGFAFPGFMGSPHSHYADPFHEVAEHLPADGPLGPRERRDVVAAMFRFMFPLPLNMQIALVHRRAIEPLSDRLFKPPFPDFYALNALMLRCRSWAMSSERLVVVGVSPKSFGRTVNSATEQVGGLQYLGIDSSFRGRLPGSEIVNGTYETLLALAADYGEDLASIEIDRAEYVTQQAYAWYLQRRLGSLPTRDLVRRLRLLDRRDWRLLLGMLAARARPATIRRRLAIGRSTAVTQIWNGMRELPEISDISQFAAWIEARRTPAAS
jgi:glycosyltransferase involved in cell wall biosynthesis